MPTKTFSDATEAEDVIHSLDTMGVPYEYEIQITVPEHGAEPDETDETEQSETRTKELTPGMEEVAKALQSHPAAWVQAAELDVSVDPHAQLHYMHERGAVTRRESDESTGGRIPYEYRLKEPYRREFAQYDPLNGGSD